MTDLGGTLRAAFVFWAVVAVGIYLAGMKLVRGTER